MIFVKLKNHSVAPGARNDDVAIVKEYRKNQKEFPSPGKKEYKLIWLRVLKILRILGW